MLLYALIMGGVDTGWYFYTPYSTMYTNSYVFVAAMAVFINGFSTILTGAEFRDHDSSAARPRHDLDAPALFVWSI